MKKSLPVKSRWKKQILNILIDWNGIMDYSSIRGTFQGLEITKVLNYTGDYVLFKTADGQLHVANQNEIVLGD